MKALPLIIDQNVSERARSKGQFIDQYKQATEKKQMLPIEWLKKRDGFIKRHLAQYKKNPTERRRLALLAWGYKV